MEDILGKAGITASMLLENEPRLPALEKVTNEIVLELIHFKDGNQRCTFQMFYVWLRTLYGEYWPDQPPTIQAIIRSITRLSARLAKLKKQHKSLEKDAVILGFMQQEFILPSIGLHHGKVQHFSPPQKGARKCTTKSSDQMLGETKEMKKRMYAVARNANKRLKRREALISEQKECIDSQRGLIKTYERKIKAAETKVTELRAKINRVSHRAMYWRSRAGSIGYKNIEKACELRKAIKTLKEKVSFLDLCNAEMSESILQSDMISTFEGGKYTDDVRACVYELLSLNLGVSNIAPVIRCVLRNISHKSVTRLPSHGLTCQMILESLTVVQAQLGDQLSQAGHCNTLQTDGTTKFGEHYGTYDVRVPGSGSMQTYTLGLRHVFSGSAQDTLDTLKEILADIDSVHNALGKCAPSAKIVFALKNTMSDRHAAEKLFNFHIL